MKTIPIRQAISNVSMAVKKLAKSSENKFGNYMYTSIDDYYEGIVSAAHKENLWWHMREVSVEPFVIANKYDIMRYVFAVDLYHEDTGIQGFDTITIELKVVGGQTAGIARSFAEKAFMRSLFKIRTGESDGGEMAQVQAVGSTLIPEGAKAEPTKEEIEKLHAQSVVMKEGIKAAKTRDSLFEQWFMNEEVLKKMQGDAPKMYDEVKAAFSAAKDKLK